MTSAPKQTAPPKTPFTGYQVLILVIIALIQFTVTLDFMVMAPLGPIIKPTLHINPSQFSIAVAVYAFAAGISGFLASGFADMFDRKKFLIFFYTGFVLGTLFCGLAPTYPLLVLARLLTGVFGGVISSISFAIIADIFLPAQRGRVMGFVQMAFGVSQVLGIPVGLFLAARLDWHAPFLMIVGLSIIVGVLIVLLVKPLTTHLAVKQDDNFLVHFIHTIGKPRYLLAFGTTALLTTGGYMLMPFSSDFLVHNVGISKESLPIVFLVTGIFALFAGPLMGILSDKVGRFNVFVGGTILSAAMVIVYTHLSVTPIGIVILINTVLFFGIIGRMIPAMAINSLVPEMKDRGSFMSINSSLQQISGGLASLISGMIVYQVTEESPLQNFDTVGFITCGSMLACIILMYLVHRMVTPKSLPDAPPKAE